MSNFPVSNPLDYYIGGTVDEETNKTPHHIKEKIKARITEVFVGKSCRKFRSRQEALVEANGGFFE